MTAFLLVGRLVLALVFVVASVAKLADREGSRQAIRDFGVPAALSGPLGILLPLTELSCAAALLPTATAFWGAVGALALLLLFLVGIGLNLARGNKPDCHCFGQFHSEPAGRKTLVRNGVLAVLASFLVWQGWEGEVGPSAVGWLGDLSTIQLVVVIGGLVLLGLIASQWWFLIHLLRQNGRLLTRLETLESNLAADPTEGLPLGTQAPDFNLEGLYGQTLTLNSLRATSGKPVMLLFTDPNCGPCNILLPDIARWQEEYAEKLTIALISRGDPEDNRTKTSEHGVGHVLLQKDWEVAEAYQVRSTPSAVLILPEGEVGSYVASGPDAIRSMVARLVGLQVPVPVTKKVGEVAPEAKLPDLEGNIVELVDFRGKKVLVVFGTQGVVFASKCYPTSRP